jgi:hypothetical protein
MQWKAEKINRVHASWKLSEKMDAMKIKRETMDEMETPKRDLERWSLSKTMDDEYTTQAKEKSIKGP